MTQHIPLVTIGIPTYNRAAMLRRSIKSALGQDYPAIEVVVSDNASTDDTQSACQEFRKQDGRLKYIAQSSNIGATANFADVLKRASGEYFMWLGDDDWIDPSYVSHCMSILRADPEMALVSGAPVYYRNGLKAFKGRLFDLLEKSWSVRVARFYMMVADNGMFYGIMRTAHLQTIVSSNTMGGDWHLIATIVSTGKSRMSPLVSVHRELGGATTSYRQIAKSLGLPMIQAIFPMTTIASGAWKNIVFADATFRKRGILSRIILADVVLLIFLAKSTFAILRGLKRFLSRGQLYIVNGEIKK
jgi:glycosyltransferase domain-containing protein